MVVPCYNEARRLDVKAFRTFAMKAATISFVFVDDGSTDATAEILHALQAGMESRVDVLACERGSGKLTRAAH
jgi:glycosyltransferase involved in cell wall biosynthesis